MGQVRVARVDDRTRFDEIREVLEHDHPGVKFSVVEVDGERELRSEHGGMRVFWIYRGQGEVFLPRGYRTQEGDGEPLPADYQPDPIDSAFAEALDVLKAGQPSVVPAAAIPYSAILERFKDGAFVGDYLGELWKLDHVPRPWSKEERVCEVLDWLFGVYREQGYSTKQVDSYEPLMEADQVIVSGEETIPVRGQFACLSMEKVDRSTSHVSAVRRLRFLKDTAGGCNPDFDPFRRLPLTWYYNYPGEQDDGLNWVNSHAVNIPAETSPAHFHPPKAVGRCGGVPQSEMYLVLNPETYQLNTWGRKASLIVFPDLRDLFRFEQHDLEPGMFVYMPPGTGHRGMDVFVNVLTMPGFKPHNEYYMDRDIRDMTDGKVPYNESLLGAKNYDKIEDLL